MASVGKVYEQKPSSSQEKLLRELQSPVCACLWQMQEYLVRLSQVVEGRCLMLKA